MPARAKKKAAEDPRQKAGVTVTIPDVRPEILDALRVLARDERRSLEELMRDIIEEAYEQQKNVVDSLAEVRASWKKAPKRVPGMSPAGVKRTLQGR